MADIFKVIFQLEADGKGVLDEVSKVASSYQKVNEELKKQEGALDALLRREAEILAARKKTNSPSQAAKFNEQLKKNKVEIDKTRGAITDLVKVEKAAEVEAKRLGSQLKKAFNQSTTNSVKQTGGAIDGITGKLGALAAGIGITSLIGSVIETTATFEKFAAVLENTLGSKSLAKAALNDIQEFASKTPFSVEELTRSFVKLANQGFVPTTNELTKLGDIASSQGKSFDQLTEAIIDAQTGEFERLKEFGIRAAKEGDKVKFTFKGVTTEVKGTSDEIRKYVLGLGDAEGVTGSMAAISETLGGQISNLGDKWGDFLNTLGTRTGPVIKGVVSSLAFLVDSLKGVTVTLSELFVPLDKSSAGVRIFQDLGVRSEDAAKRIQSAGLEIIAGQGQAYENLVKDINKVDETYQNLAATITAQSTRNEITSTLRSFGEEAKKLRLANESGEITDKRFTIQVKLLGEAFNLAKDRQKLFQKETVKTTDVSKKAADAAKKQLEEEFKNKQRLAEAIGLLDKIQAENNLKLRRELNKAILAEEVKLAKDKIEAQKEQEEKLLQLGQTDAGVTESEAAATRLQINEQYYADLLELAEDEIQKRKAIGLNVVEQEKEINKLRLDAELQLAQDEQKVRQEIFKESNTDITNEENVTATRLKLQNSRNSTLLDNELAFEKQRLELLRASGDEYAQEVKDQTNKVALLEKEANKQRIVENIDFTEQIVNAAISATNKILDAKIREIDAQTTLQQKRVDDAKDIAGEGNAELLQEEKKRLENLNKEKEKFVRQQQALAAVELVANTAIAISKAAAEGGAAAGITIAAALLALVAGLASARSIASQAAFYEGGYTGSGNPRDESNAIGPRNYVYHKDEFVMNHKLTRKHKDLFQGIHEGRIDLSEWSQKVKAYDGFATHRETRQLSPIVHTTVEISELKDQMATLINIVKGQNTAVNIDENGFAVHLKNVIARKDYIKNLAT